VKGEDGHLGAGEEGSVVHGQRGQESGFQQGGKGLRESPPSIVLAFSAKAGFTYIDPWMVSSNAQYCLKELS